MSEIRLLPEQILAKLDYNVLLCCLLAGVVIPILHTLLHSYVITPLGQRLCIPPAKKTDGQPGPAQQKKLAKFQESCWKCFAYIALATASAYALSKETFWRNTAEFWTDCYQTLPCPYQASPEMNFAYSVDAAYYMYAIPYACMFETRRKDYWATMAHHFVTVSLLCCSYAMGFNKIGLVIMFLHDIADPFLEVAKIGNYTSPPQPAVTNSFFIIFAMLWIIMRVFYFPIWVIYSVLFYAVDAVAGDADTSQYIWIWYVFSGMLIFLWLLDLFWAYTILGIAFAAASSGGAAQDSREDADEDYD